MDHPLHRNPCGPVGRRNASARAAALAALLLACGACAGGCGASDDAGPSVDPIVEDVDSGLAPDLGGPTPDLGGPAPDLGGPEPDLGPGPDPADPLWQAPLGAEASQELCSNGVDDDGNGYPDCTDFWCRESVVVTACGSLENTPEACSDGQDNPESTRRAGDRDLDGLVDCADPDCGKNPNIQAAGVCPALRFELGPAACADGADNDDDGLVDCADPDCLHAGASDCPLGARRRVLFDDAHRQRAGSADWVIDVSGRHPWPSVPTQETDWAGGLSSFGAALQNSGSYIVETLPAAQGLLTFGDATNPQDLSAYHVLILVEPSAPFSAEEAAAVLAFVRSGGGVLMVADHFESDRDGNDCDSVQAFNALLQDMGGGTRATNPLGFEVVELTYAASGALERLNGKVARTLAPGAADHPVLAGSHGRVERIGMYKGGLFLLHPEVNPTVTPLIHAVPLGTAGYTEGSPYVIATQLEQGRVVAVGDSAITNDGSDSHGLRSPTFDSWHKTSEHNAALLLNAVEWLGQ